MSVYEQQANAITEAREIASESGGLVHVMGAAERTDEARRPNEFVCTMAEPFTEDGADDVTVVYHPETRTAGSAYVCAACGELSGEESLASA